MTSNFDFLKNTDKELYDSIEDAQKLFRDEYFNQAVVQLRIFAEKMAKKVLGTKNTEMTFDDTLNCLKDKIKTEREKEFIEDLFFIKNQGNKCAHGEDIEPSVALEAIKRAFEASINYIYSKKKDEKINRLEFDDTLLITGKRLKETPLVEKYVQLAQEQKEELLNLKQGEFNLNIDKNQDGIRNESYVKNPKSYSADYSKEKTTKSTNVIKNKPKKKQLTPAQERVKNKVKEAKKNLKQNINTIPKKQTKKQQKARVKAKNKLLKFILFLSFVTISLFFLTKMLFFF